MAKQIVLQNEIDQQYSKFVNLNDNFHYSYTCINNELELIVSSYVRSGGKMNAIMTCQSESQRLLNVCATLEQGAELLRLSKETLRNLDDSIRQQINNQEFSTLDRLSYGDTGSGSRVVSEEEYRLITAYDSKEQLPYDPNTGKDLGWCAGYAYARFNYLFPDTLPNPPGDAKNWLYSCADQPNLDVVWGDWSSLKDIKTPCAAISQNPPYGHVIIIEGVTYNEDGSIREIYWSESNGQYDPVRHPDGYDTSSYYFTEGYDGVMNKYTVGSDEQIPWVLSSIAGFVCYTGA